MIRPLSLAIVFAMTLTARADDDLRATAVKVGSGPLLTTTSTEGQTRICSVLEAEVSPPQLREFLRLPDNITVHARLERGRLLVERHGPHGGLLVADLDKGTVTPLVPEVAHRTRLLAVSSDQVLVLVELAKGDIGFRLEERGKTAKVLSAPRPGYQILAVDPTGRQAPRALHETAVEHVFVLGIDELWVVAQGPDDRELWRLPRRTGAARKVLAWPSNWQPGLSTAEVSPDGRRIALGVGRTEDFFDTRDLVVLDAETGREMFAPQRITVRVSMLSSSSPRLEMTWLDPDRLRYSETVSVDGELEGRASWVDLDVTSGRRAGALDRGPIGLRHDKPLLGGVSSSQSPERCAAGHFDRTKAGIHFRGEAAPILDVTNAYGQVPWEAAQVSPEGAYCALFTTKPPFALHLAKSSNRSVCRVRDGFYENPAWLPAIPAR